MHTFRGTADLGLHVHVGMSDDNAIDFGLVL